VLGIGVVLFEIATVLVLRAHYTMDVFTGIVTALWVAAVCDRIAPPADFFLLRGK
jgi:membrane-associated phospholipid phosphatase